MDTGTKILVGAAVVIGGVVVYKTFMAPNPVRDISKSTATPPGGTLSGFLNLATSLTNYFTKNQPQQQITPGSRASLGPWDSTSDLYLPLKPGETAYADDTSHDSLLS